MQNKKIWPRIRQIFVSVGQWFKNAFRFRKGNLLDQIFRGIVVVLFIALIGSWVVNNFINPKEPDQPERVEVLIEEAQLANAVKQELQFLLATEYSWIFDQPAPAGLGASVAPVSGDKPNPQESRPSDAVDAVETLAISFDRILWPLKSEVATTFGWHRHPTYQDWRFHGGLELVATSGDQIRSVLAGRVESILPSDAGFEIVIGHGSGWQTVFQGIRSVAVKIGDLVDQNDVLANVGDDGKIFFAMLHEGEAINPMQYMSLY